MSWLAPKHLEDASRILRGLALVASKMASDSKLARRSAVSDYQYALQYAADLLAHQAATTQQADAAASAATEQQPPPSSASQQTSHETAPSAVPHSDSPNSPLTAAASQPAAPLIASLSGGLTGQVTRQDVASEATDVSSTMAVATGVAGPAMLPLAPTFAAQGFAAQLRAAAAAEAETAEVEVVTLVVSERTAGLQPSPSHVVPPASPPPPPQQQHPDPFGERLAAVASAPQQVPLHEAVSEATAAAASRGDGTCDPSSLATSVEAPEGEAAAADATADVLPPYARLPSVHDDMVVAAIAGSQQQPATGTSAAAAGAAGEAGVPGSGGRVRDQTSSPSSSARSTPPPLQTPPRKLRERRVPETPLGRALGFAGLGASLLVGSLSDSVGRAVWGHEAAARGQDGAGGSGGGSGGGGGSPFLTQANAERLANALCRMRGAALKIGQMLSIQDESVLPPQFQAALERVRSGADVMPRSQLESVLAAELGPTWREQLSDFEWEPRAAASIGQVHSAVLTDGRRVAMKIQYPGVARSIESDVDNLMRLIAVANILPRGLYAENAAKVAKRELALECDYSHELQCQRRYRDLLSSSPDLALGFHVPGVVPELSSQRILTTEWVAGVPLDKVCELPQHIRDSVATRLLDLTLRELFEWRFMQTDPNWGNFLYDIESDKINLIDFGASRDYPEFFVTDYLRMVAACAEEDRQAVIDMSIKLGFLTGDESEVMLDAHTRAGFVVGMPFAAPGLYDFGSHGGMTSRVSELGGVMLKHRLTPPPQESYSLHRKLSGAFLACMKLKAKVACRDMFFRTYESILGPYVPPRLAK